MEKRPRDPTSTLGVPRVAQRAVPVPRWLYPGREIRRRLESALPVLLLTPSVIAVLIFVYGFIGWTVYISLTRWNDVLPDYTFIGLRNYVGLFQTPRFQADIRNVVVFTTLFLLGAIGVGFFAALLLDQRVKGETFFRSVFLFPMAISFIVTGIAWQWLFNPQTGINLLLKYTGYAGPLPRWFTDPSIMFGVKVGAIQVGIPVALIPVVIAATWQLSGFTMAMYLAGLRGIPEELREAARVDGASEWQIYRHVVLPLLRPVTLSALIVLGHISLKIFDLTVAMTGSGPGFATDMPAYFMFETTFRGNHFAQGAAIATLMLLLVAALIIPYLRYSLSRETEL
ncbi:carbohydrate ABC transporter permease [Thermoflexus sp.]|uniref:carbohydrate ABC transporter permease n=1 Tax=Thermoflexus sp. TaxID=1969742 RepID=UPI0035E44719